jgi:hypothetical protein
VVATCVVAQLGGSNLTPSGLIEPTTITLQAADLVHRAPGPNDGH